MKILVLRCRCAEGTVTPVCTTTPVGGPYILRIPGSSACHPRNLWHSPRQQRQCCSEHIAFSTSSCLQSLLHLCTRQKCHNGFWFRRSVFVALYNLLRAVRCYQSIPCDSAMWAYVFMRTLFEATKDLHGVSNPSLFDSIKTSSPYSRQLLSLISPFRFASL